MDSRVTPPKRSWFSWFCSLLQSPLLLAIRLIWGILFIYAGMAKLGDMGATIAGFDGYGIPYPEWSAWLVALVETIGGALLVVGLFTRLAAIPLAITMIGAFLMAHKDALAGLPFDFAPVMNQDAFYYLLAALTLIAFGPGWFSLDNLWCAGHKCKVENNNL